MTTVQELIDDPTQITRSWWNNEGQCYIFKMFEGPWPHHCMICVKNAATGNTKWTTGHKVLDEMIQADPLLPSNVDDFQRDMIAATLEERTKVLRHFEAVYNLCQLYIELQREVTRLTDRPEEIAPSWYMDGQDRLYKHSVIFDILTPDGQYKYDCGCMTQVKAGHYRGWIPEIACMIQNDPLVPSDIDEFHDEMQKVDVETRRARIQHLADVQFKARRMIVYA